VEKRHLGYDRDLLSEVVQADIGGVDAVDQDGPLEVGQSEQRRDQRGLPGTCPTYNPDLWG
jgi:hypothetical protein